MVEEGEILLVEDNRDDAELAMRALEENNLVNPIVWVRDGAEALEFLFREGRHAGRPESQPRLILLDLKLPLVDGHEVLARIGDDPRTRLVPVVVLTSSQQERDRLQSYLLGVNSYIVKPVDFSSFVEAMRIIGMYWLLLNQPPPGTEGT
ncbi:MAG: response regulator [Actinobacteria bacterium ATB1]|nr:response regulator [Actinobacteria bacterium ATB1]